MFSLVLLEEYQKVRKSWRQAFWIFLISAIVFTFFNTISEMRSHPEQASDLFASQMTSWFFGIIYWPIFYHCTYRKQGTKLLALQNFINYICLFLSLVVMIGSLLLLGMADTTETGQFYTNLLCFSLLFVVIAFFQFRSYHLRKWNLKAKEDINLLIVHNSVKEELRDLIRQFQECKEVENLKLLFTAAVRTKPKYQSHLFIAYKAQLNALENQSQ